MACRGLIAGLLVAVLATAAAAHGRVAEPDCRVGAYRLGDGTVVDIGLSDGGYRWRTLDGATGKLTASADRAWDSAHGWTGRPEALRVRFGPCAAAAIDFGGKAGRRIAFDTKDAEFVSHGATLKGRLILPQGTAPVAVVVLLQGAERDSALDYDPLQRILPAEGVGAFVYDKRGTGASEGAYTQDFSLLADDAVAALQTARKLGGGRIARIGFEGPSQGGWIAPIAASRAPVDFVIVAFGLAVTVLDEDREAVAVQMFEKGYGVDAIAGGLEISDAAGALFESGFTTGFERFEAVRAKYRNEPWFKDVRGNFTHVFLEMSPEELRKAGPDYRWNTPFRYDPMPTLSRLATPQLWILGGKDIDAPSGETVLRLKRLIAERRPISLALYPRAEHGMTEFETARDGSRLSTRYAQDYFRLLADFARDGRLRPPYGDARITSPR